MTKTREAEQEASFWGYQSPRHKPREDEAVPLHYLTTAYRRKRTMDAVMDPELRQDLVEPDKKGSRQVVFSGQAVLHQYLCLLCWGCIAGRGQAKSAFHSV